MKRGMQEWIAVALVIFVLAFNIILVLAFPLLDKHFTGNLNAVVIRGYAVQHGGYEPKIIKVKVNESVKVIFYAMDLPQSLSIEAADIDTGVVIPDEPGMNFKVIELNFTNIGLYIFRNSIPNGPMSPFQIGYFVVEGE